MHAPYSFRHSIQRQRTQADIPVRLSGGRLDAHPRQLQTVGLALLFQLQDPAGQAAQLLIEIQARGLAQGQPATVMLRLGKNLAVQPLASRPGAPVQSPPGVAGLIFTQPLKVVHPFHQKLIALPFTVPTHRGQRQSDRLWIYQYPPVQVPDSRPQTSPTDSGSRPAAAPAASSRAVQPDGRASDWCSAPPPHRYAARSEE